MGLSSFGLESEPHGNSTVKNKRGRKYGKYFVPYCREKKARN